MSKFLLRIDEHSRVPKYQQIVNGIVENVQHGRLRIDDKIPSINALSERFELSRDTVEKAYRVLKQRAVITSVKGKGFYITRTELLNRVNVLFLVNKLSSYKMRIYNSFVQQLGQEAHTDLHVYHCEEALFLKLLEKYRGGYDYFVVMPHFKTSQLQHLSAPAEVVRRLNELPPEKVILLDNNLLELRGAHAKVYQDFEEDLYQALSEGIDKIRKYRKLLLVYPRQQVYPYPKRILYGFRKFCVAYKLPFEVIDAVPEDVEPQVGELYLTIEESDLVNLVKQLRDRGLQPGRDVGVISYNDTPLKDLLGISVVSTDFDAMGRTAAELIRERRVEQLRNPFRWIERDSV